MKKTILIKSLIFLVFALIVTSCENSSNRNYNASENYVEDTKENQDIIIIENGIDIN